MSKVSTAVLVIALLLLNNIVLYYFFSNGQQDRHELSIKNNEQRNVAGTQLASDASTTQSKAHEDHDTGFLNSEFSDGLGQTTPDIDSAIAKFMDSPEFSDLLDRYLRERQVQQKSTQQQYREKTTEELLGLLDTDLSDREKTIAQELLFHRDLSGFELHELRQLYLNENSGWWLKAKALNALLDKGDAQGIYWTKEFVSSQKNGRGSFELVEKLHEVDRDYFVDKVEQTSMEEFIKSNFLDVFIYKDEKLVTQFLEKHIDEILETDSPAIYTKFKIPMNVELSRSQEASIGDLLFSERGTARAFAANLAGNISDVDILRRGFDGLKNVTEKRLFLNSLMRDPDKNNHVELAIDLGSKSEDPQVKQLLQRLQ